MTPVFLRFIFVLAILFPPKDLSAFFHAPIDVVYTWVDGSDKEWEKEKREWQKKENLVSRDGATAGRFRDREELRYSLRSIHKFAPFIRKIFIVTNGQAPKWLKKHPKVQIIKHSEIFKNRAYLPTFNSIAIECNLHRIPGLSEHYLYMNDDFFLGHHVVPAHFFTSQGKTRVIFSSRAVPEGLPVRDESGYASAAKNTNLLLNGLYKHEKRYPHAHTPYVQIKSVVKKIEEKFFHIFDLVSSHRFRCTNDYNITNGLIPYVALHMGCAQKSDTSRIYFSFGKDQKKNRQMFEKIHKERPAFFCIADSGDNLSDQQLNELNKFFEKYYPKPAPWEK